MIEWVEQLAKKRVVVIGDLVADEYIYGETSRVSREAPVLVVRYTSHEYKLGGAANAAANVQALGGIAIPVGVIGNDEAGHQLKKGLKSAKMPTGHLITASRATTTKTRILAGSVHTTKQQVLRLDREESGELGAGVERRMVQALRSLAGRCDAVLVSDYGLGVLSPLVKRMLSELAASGTIVCVDSRFDALSFRGVTAITPNEPEAEALYGQSFTSDEVVLAAGAHLQKSLQTKAVLITRGRRGMVLFSPSDAPVVIPIAGTDEVSDVTGAGDTVIATFTLALAAGAPLAVAARLANCAASVTVMKAGAAVCSPSELRQAISRLPVSVATNKKRQPRVRPAK